MEHIAMDNKKSIEFEMTQIWSIYDLLRKNGIGLDQRHIILLLLSLYKDGLISRDFLFNKNLINIIDLTDKLPNHKSEHYQSILPSFGSEILSIDKNEFKLIVNKIFEIDKVKLSANFPEIFDNVFHRIYQSIGKFSGEFIQPADLTRFIVGLANLEKNSKVFNPFAGMASFGVYLEKEQYYYGQEIIQKNWAIGALRLLAYNKLSFNTAYTCEDSIVNWPSSTEKFDLIVSNPPMGLKFSQKYGFDFPEYKSFESYLFERSISSLNDTGKFISVLPLGFLYKNGQERFIRESIVQNDLLDMVISIPNGLLKYTNIPFCIIVLNKEKSQQGVVRFVDARSYISNENHKDKQIEVTSLIELIRNNVENDSLRIAGNHLIREFGYNLNVPRYFQKEIDGVKLGDIFNVEVGRRSEFSKIGKLIRIKDLKNDILDFNLDVLNVDDSELKTFPIRIINETCLLLAIRWETLKPTLFEYTGIPIFISSDILSYKVNNETVDIAYLINELHSDYVQEQIDSLKLGGTIPFIRKEDLFEVKIKLPSILEQRAIVLDVREAMVAEKVEKVTAEAKKYGLYNQYFQDISALKHAFGKPLLKINSSLANLQTALLKLEKSNKVDIMNCLISENYNYTIKNQFDSIKDNLLHLSILLENSDKELSIDNYQFDTVDITFFLRSYIDELKMNNSINFKVHLESAVNEIDWDEFGVVFINANENLLKILFDNITDNIIRHGFTENVKSYDLIFYIGIAQLDNVHYVEIEIVNNGNPFPANFDQDKFILKNFKAGNTGNTGLGGYQINQIISHLNGKFQLDLDNDSPYPVSYTIYLPFIELKSELYEEL